jgi:hypothetical protein
MSSKERIEMKYIKTLGLLAVAVAVTMALAASASADYITTTTDGATPALKTETIHLVNEGGEAVLENDIANIKCQSTAEGKIETHTSGKNEDAAAGALTSMIFTACTDNWHVTTNTPGTLSITWTNGHNGTVFLDGFKITATRLFVPCVYQAVGAHIGNLTGGNPATLHVAGFLTLNELESSELCGVFADWLKGSYTTTGAAYVVNS